MLIFKIAGLIMLAVIILYLLAIMPRMINRPDRTPFLSTLYAHRGLHDNAGDAPENSMEAFRRAIQKGYGIELDVQLTKDEIPVVFHDFTLKRVCGVEGRVSDYTYEELKEFSLCDSSEKIPLFKDVIALVNGQVPLIIEYKIPKTDAKVCKVANELLKDYKGLYCIESFNPLGLLWYKNNRKDVMRGILSTDYIADGEKGYPKILFFLMHNLLFNFLIKPDFVAYNHRHYKDLSRNICRYLYRDVSAAWTIKTQEQLDLCRKHFDIFIFDSFIPEEESK